MSSTLDKGRDGLRERQKRDRRRRILNAARKLFDRRVSAPSMMQEVASRAGLAVGTLYNYFPTRDDLLLAIMKRESRRVTEVGTRILNSPPPINPIDGLLKIADVFVDAAVADGRRLWREALIAAMTKPETIGARLFELDSALIAQFQALITKLKSTGRLAAAVDPFHAATLIYAVCLTWGMAFLMSDAVDAQTMREGIRTGIALAVSGLLPHSNAASPRC